MLIYSIILIYAKIIGAIKRFRYSWWVSQLVSMLSPYIKVAGLMPSQGRYKNEPMSDKLVEQQVDGPPLFLSLPSSLFKINQ